nr:10132_t:CDS:2 [Entrophospora candida]
MSKRKTLKDNGNNEVSLISNIDIQALKIFYEEVLNANLKVFSHINMDMMNIENGNNTSIENIIADELTTMDQQTETNNCNLDINSRLFLSHFSITDDASREENKIMV